MPHDLLVIGGGPAGYTAAIRAAQLGLTVACIDARRDAQGRPVLGGTCLNVGCIPSKALLDSSHRYAETRDGLAVHGIGCGTVTLDLAVMQQRKDGVVERLTRGLETLFRGLAIEWLPGAGRLLGPERVQYLPHEGQPRELTARHVILAAGSQAATLPAAPVDGVRVLDSTGALALDRVPASLLIVGAGVVGLELGSIWRRLGAQVTLLEMADRLLPALDPGMAREAARLFKAQGLDIRFGCRVLETTVEDTGVRVRYRQGERTESLAADRLIVAAGRTAATEELTAPEVALPRDAQGHVQTDELCRTELPNVYAIGDLAAGPMLAHKGAEEGVAVAEMIASGRPRQVRHDTIPWVVYTAPEIAWVGESETAARARGARVRVGEFNLAALGRALAYEAGAGRVRLVADADTDALLGAQILSPMASELIHEAVLALEFGASSEDLARTVHAHPSFAEAVHEAALDVDARAIHKMARQSR